MSTEKGDVGEQPRQGISSATHSHRSRIAQSRTQPATTGPRRGRKNSGNKKKRNLVISMPPPSSLPDTPGQAILCNPMTPDAMQRKSSRK